MSMTSKVNATLREQILGYLAANPNSTNTQIYFGVPSLYSQRSIQEATQKLTNEGTLVRNGRKFSIAPATSGSATAASA